MGGLLTAGALALGAAAAAPSAEAVTLVRSDLDFILRQIQIAEAHAAGGTLAGPGPLQVGSPLLPFGLRTVDGSLNNIVPGQESFGQADKVFPRLLAPTFVPAETLPFDPDGPGPLQAGDPTSYAQTSDIVSDSRPRTISNLVVDATPTNPAAAAVSARTPGSVQVPDGDGQPDPFFIPNRAPDAGLSAPFNSWFTFFGQFFDHGLDLVTKGGNGTVMIPLQPGDPLIAGPNGVLGDGDDLPPERRFMVLTRATNQGATREHQNTTTPFVDQNQTYTSNPSHQVFLREYELRGGRPFATGRLLDGANGGLATWADVKRQAQDLLGIALTDQDVLNVPAVQVDPYGKFIPDSAGRPQLTGQRTGHAFLDDIAHAAAPSGDQDGLPGGTRGPLVADPDSAIGLAQNPPGQPQLYDDELLTRHFITGDGRGNENIGLTAVHQVFHAEHNRLVEAIKGWVTGTGDATFIAQWQVAPGVWNGERLFQAARFTTEMQYQHLVFEEFARKVQPDINVFAGYATNIDPAIVSEFANTVYRFGHSMLPETVARTATNGADQSLPLVQAFLNPEAFAGTAAAVGAVARGNTRQVGNEIDEFVTDSVRSNLLGLPLDLGAINIARGRDTGVPPLQVARRQFFAQTSNSTLAPYDSWSDFGLGLRNPESLGNFIAAYGKHPSITVAATPTDKRNAAQALIARGNQDAIDFMDSAGTWSAATPTAAGATPDVDTATVTGLGDVDLWIGGLGEKPPPFGGMLGSTFNFVFETQLEKLQDGDRFYYLSRLAGTNFLSELEASSFSQMVMRNSDALRLPGDPFARPDFLFAIDNPNGLGAAADPWTLNGRVLASLQNGQLRFVGPEHVIMGGNAAANNLRTDEGDDTVWGESGNDRLEGAAGNDVLNGGPGNDIVQDTFGIDTIGGDAGNDALNGGPGLDELFGGAGSDLIDGGADANTIFGGTGNDMVIGGDSSDVVNAGEGDDWLEGGDQADALAGGEAAPFEDSTSDGNDVIDGQGGDDDQMGEGGDDVLKSGAGIEKHQGMLGFDWVTHKGDPQAAQADLNLNVLLPPDQANIRDRFRLVEGLSGWNQNDVLRGDDATAATMLGNTIDTPAQIGVITGLQGVLGAGVTAFTGGNIILGGAGSDIIEGRAGNDVIDGDKWLDVQIQSGGGAPVDTLGAIRAGVFGGTIDPGGVSIRREIKDGGAPNDIDTAEFSGPSTEYTISPPPGSPAPGGTVTVSHVAPVPPLDDGTDRLTGIERLRFTDQTIALVANPNNNPALGQPGISSLTPTEGQALTANPGSLTDSDGVNPASFEYTWQTETAPGAWASIATGPAFTPGNAEVGQRLRVVAVFRDNDGQPESGTSVPTAGVINVNSAPTGAPVLSDTSPVVGSPVTVSTAGIADADGLANVAFAYQWQQGSGATWTNIIGATGTSLTPGDGQLGQQLRVRVTFTDNGGAPETVFSAPTAATVSARTAAESAPPRILGPPLPVTAIKLTRANRTLASHVILRFRVGGAATVRMQVRTATGKRELLRTYRRTVKKAGIVSFRWNLTNARNDVVKDGRYRLVVSIVSRRGTTTFSRAVTIRRT